MKTRPNYYQALLCFTILWLALASEPLAAGRIDATVLQVYDGDTIQVKMGRRTEKVRFIGIDCPEARENDKFVRDMKREKRHKPVEVLAFGRQAREFTEKACPPGTVVQLDMDAEERDKYGRLLAYVWVDGIMLNAELVEAGLAKLMTIPPNVSNAALFRKLQAEAEKSGKGIWAE